MASLRVTTLERVKAASPHASTVNDARIVELIDTVSGYVETGLARHMKFQRYTGEVYRVPLSQPIVWLRGMPIEVVHGVKYADRRSFSDVSPLLSTDFDIDYESGQIELKVTLTGNPGYVEVDYEGGMASDTAAFIAAYPEIAEAATLDVVNRLGRQGNPEGEVRAFDSGIRYATGQLKALSTLDMAIAARRRRVQ